MILVLALSVRILIEGYLLGKSSLLYEYSFDNISALFLITNNVCHLSIEIILSEILSFFLE